MHYEMINILSHYIALLHFFWIAEEIAKMSLWKTLKIHVLLIVWRDAQTYALEKVSSLH